MKKLFYIVVAVGLVIGVPASKAVIFTDGEYRQFIEQNEFVTEYTGYVSYIQKARMLEHIRNAYTMSSEATIREAFREIANGNMCLRAELEYISRISGTRNELLFNLHYMMEAYYSLTNDDRTENRVVFGTRNSFNSQNY